MKIEKNHPIITSDDYPKTVFDALADNTVYRNAGDDYDQSWAWYNLAQDSIENLYSSFGVSYDGVAEAWPKRRDALLYVPLDMLELALVNHGCEVINRDEASPVLRDIDELLCSIDGLRHSIRQ